MAIVFIGMPGSGKTTLGAALAERMGWQFIDTDHLIEQESGQRKSELYREDAMLFRVLERRIIENLPRGESQVIALGGGVLEALPPGRIVYLDVAEELLWERLQQRGLPATIDADAPRASFRVLYAERRSHYSRHADLTLRISADSSFEQLLSHLENFLQDQQ